jgi:LmbE family N-acetylglucosaminyl deacetylase
MMRALEMSLNGKDRLLVLAPHPDDESLATGGLIQRAARLGLPVKVVFLTNGENNPWAQRIVERRWRIGSADQQRWGELRQAEVRSALNRLGHHLAPIFLNLPDQGLTKLLLYSPGEMIQPVLDQIETFAPTVIALPCLQDAHADHSATRVAALYALIHAERFPRLLSYVVHQPRKALRLPAQPIVLSEAERLIKLSAIHCHESQLHVLPHRFTRFAQREEAFRSDENALALTIGARLSFSRSEDTAALGWGAWQLPTSATEVLFSFLLTSSKAVGWRLSLRGREAGFLANLTSNHVLGRVQVKREGDAVSCPLPLTWLPDCSVGYVKIGYRSVFFDPAGWFPIPLETWQVGMDNRCSPQQTAQVEAPRGRKAKLDR